MTNGELICGPLPAIIHVSARRLASLGRLITFPEVSHNWTYVPFLSCSLNARWPLRSMHYLENGVDGCTFVATLVVRQLWCLVLRTVSLFSLSFFSFFFRSVVIWHLVGQSKHTYSHIYMHSPSLFPFLALNKTHTHTQSEIRPTCCGQFRIFPPPPPKHWPMDTIEQEWSQVIWSIAHLSALMNV